MDFEFFDGWPISHQGGYFRNFVVETMIRVAYKMDGFLPDTKDKTTSK